MSWTVKNEADKLLVVCDGFELASLTKETKQFALSFPLDTEDSNYAELLLLRALTKGE